MTIETFETEGLAPSQAEAETAERLSRALARQLAEGNSAVIFSDKSNGVEEALPAPAAKLLVKILSEIAKGNAVAVVPLKPEMTTQEAADLLNVSRPHLIKLVEQGELAFHRVGTHRRIRLADVLAYKRRFLHERKAILRELSAEAQELNMGYD
jgi:excisionase family DNA binding protein